MSWSGYNEFLDSSGTTFCNFLGPPWHNFGITLWDPKWSNVIRSVHNCASIDPKALTRWPLRAQMTARAFRNIAKHNIAKHMGNLLDCFLVTDGVTCSLPRDLSCRKLLIDTICECPNTHFKNIPYTVRDFINKWSGHLRKTIFREDESAS